MPERFCLPPIKDGMVQQSGVEPLYTATSQRSGTLSALPSIK